MKIKLSDDAELLGIDTGYSSTKVADLGDNTFQFPTLISPYIDQGLAVADSKAVSQDPISLDGKSYLVGVSYYGADLALSPDFHGSQDWRICVCWAIYQVLKSKGLIDGLGKGEPLEVHLPFLAVGLPYGIFSLKNQEALAKNCKFEFSIGETPVTLTIGNIGVEAQGWSARCNLQGEGREGLVDIGHRTVDIVTMNDGGLERPLCVSEECGVSFVYKMLSAALGKQLEALTLTDKKILDAIKTKRLFYKKQWWDVADLVNQVLDLYVDILFKSVRKVWGSNLEHYDRLCLTGGGAELLVDRDIAPFEIPENPVFSNALGYVDSFRSYLGGSSEGIE